VRRRRCIGAEIGTAVRSSQVAEHVQPFDFLMQHTLRRLSEDSEGRSMNVTSGQTPHTGSPEPAAASARLVSELASRIGSLGVELADVAGNLDEVSGRVSNESDQFKEL
jgi:hypothetical protein